MCFAEERRGERENLCPAEERRAGRENLRRDTPPMSPAAQRRERRMPQVPADAFLPRAKGRTTKSLRPAAAAPGLPYVHEYTFASTRRRSRLTLFCLLPRRACRLTSLLSRRRGAQPCLSTASDTQSRPLSFRMQYLYARCAASHLLPLPRAASIAPLRRAGVSVCPPVCLEDGPRASPRAVQPEYLSGMGRRTSPRGSSSRTSIQSSHAESSRFV